MSGLFVTATGTAAGKTFISCALARAVRQRGRSVAAIKPIETGVEEEPADALALAEASGKPALAHAEGLFRARPPLAPYAVERLGGPAVGPLSELADRVRDLGADSDLTLVEGAGGVLVPIDAQHNMADFALELGFPVVLVAEDALGVLSYTLTAVEALERRQINLRAVLLNAARPTEGDLSPQSNQLILRHFLPDLLVYALPSAQRPEDLISNLEPLLNELDL